MWARLSWGCRKLACGSEWHPLDHCSSAAGQGRAGMQIVTHKGLAAAVPRPESVLLPAGRRLDAAILSCSRDGCLLVHAWAALWHPFATAWLLEVCTGEGRELCRLWCISVRYGQGVVVRDIRSV